MTTALEQPMTQPDSEEQVKAKSDKTTTKIDRELLRKANMVALHKRIDLFDYIASILEPTVSKDYDGVFCDRDKPKGGRKKDSP